mmetsp:Transcript_20230/g.56374  ORF Transcript_20230/g.56374 Transcript_20230/m.56374 type:complete len:86 (-) Transcript_20230:359-616(-)
MALGLKSCYKYKYALYMNRRRQRRALQHMMVQRGTSALLVLPIKVGSGGLQGTLKHVHRVQQLACSGSGCSRKRERDSVPACILL